ncbi:MAG TPA: hypothetical protein VF890_04060 [Gemmatimonadales bacterium]
MGRTPASRPLLLLGATTLAAVVLFGCRAGTEPNLADIGGTWQYTETFSDVSHAITCADSGTYSLSQAGASFVGLYFQRGMCHTPTGLTDNTDSGTVSEGRVVGRTLRFRAPFCEYDGAVDAESGASITGHVVCVITDPTKQLNFSGTWQAIR